MTALRQMYQHHQKKALEGCEQTEQTSSEIVVPIYSNPWEFFPASQIDGKFFPVLAKLAEIVALISLCGDHIRRKEQSQGPRFLACLHRYAKLGAKAFAKGIAAHLIASEKNLASCSGTRAQFLVMGTRIARTFFQRLDKHISYEVDTDTLAGDVITSIRRLFRELGVPSAKLPSGQAQTKTKALEDELQYLKGLDWVEDFIKHLFEPVSDQVSTQLRIFVGRCTQIIQEILRERLSNFKVGADAIETSQATVRLGSDTTRNKRRELGQHTADTNGVFVTRNVRDEKTSPESGFFNTQKIYSPTNADFENLSERIRPVIRGDVSFSSLLKGEICQLKQEINLFSNGINARVEAERERKHHSEMIKMYHDFAYFVQQRYSQDLKSLLNRIGLHIPDLVLENEKNAFEFLIKYQRMHRSLEDHVRLAKRVYEADIEAISKLSLFNLARDYFGKSNPRSVDQELREKLFLLEISLISLYPGSRYF